MLQSNYVQEGPERSPGSVHLFIDLGALNPEVSITLSRSQK